MSASDEIRLIDIHTALGGISVMLIACAGFLCWIVTILQDILKELKKPARP